ncbi:hypothetical protein M5K25_001321 [Dendrobium thyrsiflorum]|uniref:Transmembrane protein n=1 Tax=Dendrobium thyrsiflorum TaxID=117978 RepID=A0ABD0VPT5_DENTH
MVWVSGNVSSVCGFQYFLCWVDYGGCRVCVAGGGFWRLRLALVGLGCRRLFFVVFFLFVCEPLELGFCAAGVHVGFGLCLVGDSFMVLISGYSSCSCSFQMDVCWVCGFSCSRVILCVYFCSDPFQLFYRFRVLLLTAYDEYLLLGFADGFSCWFLGS